MSQKFYVFSLRDVMSSHIFTSVVEFEDVILNSLGATLISPNNVNELNLPNTNSQPIYLFIAGINIYDIVSALKYAKKHLNHFEGIYAFVTDPFIYPAEVNKPEWRRRISSSYKYIKKITHLFVPFEYSVQALQKTYNIPVSFMPYATDVLKFGGATKHKFVDINGYGRQEVNCSRLLSTSYNQQNSSRIYHHTDHTTISHVNDGYAYRRYFWQLLRGSKIALAFDPLTANNDGRFEHSFIGPRWFESTAAGCVVVGTRPTCDEMNLLFPLPQSTIELPDNEKQILPFFEELLTDIEALDEIGTNNYLYALDKHDWRHRLLQMLTILKITPPAQLLSQIDKLSEIKESFLKRDLKTETKKDYHVVI